MRVVIRVTVRVVGRVAVRVARRVVGRIRCVLRVLRVLRVLARVAEVCAHTDSPSLARSISLAACRSDLTVPSFRPINADTSRTGRSA